MKRLILTGCVVAMVCGGGTEVLAQVSKAEAQEVALELRRVERTLKRAFEDGDRITIRAEGVGLSKLLGRTSRPGDRFGACNSAASALYNLYIDFTSANGPLPSSVRRSTENFNRWMPQCEQLAGGRKGQR